MMLKIGDVVQLKSIGPKMTVNNIRHYVSAEDGPKTTITCMWFADNNLRDGSFAQDALEIVKPTVTIMREPLVRPIDYIPPMNYATHEDDRDFFFPNYDKDSL